MNEFVLVTYVISLIALAVSLYALLEVHYIKQRRNNTEKRLNQNQMTQHVKSTKGKGHWD